MREVGNRLPLPPGWAERALDSVASVRLSNVDKKTTPGEQSVRLCNYTDVYYNDWILESLDLMRATATDSEVRRFGLQAGDVLITKDSEAWDDIGVPAYVPKNLNGVVCGYHLALIRADKSLVDGQYLAYAMNSRSVARQLELAAQGVTRYGLGKAAISGAVVALPSIREQKRIAEILDTLDETIAATDRLIAKMALRNAAVERSVFEGLPTGDQIRLDQVALVERGRFTARPRNDPRFYGGTHPFAQTGDVSASGRGVLTAVSQSLNGRGAGVSRSFPAGSIAVTIAANIGDTAILACETYLPDSVVGVVPRDLPTARWIEMCIHRHKAQLEACAPQSAQKNINLQDLRPLSLPRIPDELQRRLGALYDEGERSVSAERARLRKLHALRSGLADDLLTGRVRTMVV